MQREEEKLAFIQLSCSRLLQQRHCLNMEKLKRRKKHEGKRRKKMKKRGKIRAKLEEEKETRHRD